jgi:hypothetical protein
MIQLNDQLLSELGLRDLPGPHKNMVLKAIYAELEMRVGLILARQMTTEQLDEFEAYIKADDQDGALAWLSTNFPDYRAVVKEEFEKLRMEVSNSRGAISALSILYRPTPQSSAR